MRIALWRDKCLSFELIYKIIDTPFLFHTHDEARTFFLELQNELKNMNFMPFKSDRYEEAYARAKEKIEMKKGIAT